MIEYEGYKSNQYYTNVLNILVSAFEDTKEIKPFQFENWEEYFSLWIKAIKKAQKVTQDQLKKGAFDVIPFENYKIPFHLQSIDKPDFLVSFIIPAINEFIGKNSIKAKKMNMRKFLSSCRTSLEIIDDRQIPKNLVYQPLIVTQSFDAGKDYLLLDGNHRLQQHLENKAKDVRFFYLSLDQLIEARAFQLDLEFVLLQFMVEAGPISDFTKAIKKVAMDAQNGNIPIEPDGSIDDKYVPKYCFDPEQSFATKYLEGV